MALYVPCCCNFNFDFTVPVLVKIENNFFVPQLFAFVPCFFLRAQAVVYENTESKVSKYGVFSGPCFLVFGLNMENTDQKKLHIWILFIQ